MGEYSGQQQNIRPVAHNVINQLVDTIIKKVKIMRRLKRRYVYEDDYNMIIDWAKLYKIQSPNNVNNFPYYLEQYINSLKK